MPVLIYETGPLKGQTIQLDLDKVYNLGRDESLEVVVDDELASRVHAKIRGKAGTFFIKDATSSNGTQVNDHVIHGIVELRSGDKVTIGSTMLSFFLDEDSGAGAGRTLGGYKLLQRLGRGGMGTVYRALQLSLNREVALKILSPELSRDPSFVSRFLKEARAAGQLNHPNIVQVYDVDRAEGLTFYAMEFVPGATVEDRLNREGRVEVNEALRMLLDAAKGLQYAELKKIVHRDIKPDNLMLTEIGTVKIADLGLAHATHEGDVDRGIIGTPHFISPEQARSQTLDTRSDLYSLGATFFRILTGKTMFHGEKAEEIVLKQVKEDPPSIRELRPEIPEKVAAICMRMVRKDPAERHQTVAELIEDIESVLSASGGKKTAILIGLAVVVLAAVGVFIGLGRNGGGNPSTNGPTVVVDDSRSEELSQQMAEQQQQLDLERRENEAMKARFELDERAADLPRAELVAALEELASKFEGTAAAETAQAKADDIRAVIDGEREALAEREARLDQAVKAMETAVAEKLAQKEYVAALLAVVAADGLDADLAGDDRIRLANNRLQQQVRGAVETEAKAILSRLESNIAANDFDAARVTLDEAVRLFTTEVELPESVAQVKNLLATSSAAATELGNQLQSAEQEYRQRLLDADLRRLRLDFDWDVFFLSLREYHFGEALASLEILRKELATDSYRSYLDLRLMPLRNAVDMLDSFRTAVNTGSLVKTQLRHPARDVLAEIAGMSPDGDGLQITISRSAGSARSVLKFVSFDTVEKFVELFDGRTDASSPQRVAVAHGALLLHSALLHQIVLAVSAQIAAYDAATGWSDAQRKALVDLTLPHLSSPRLQEMLDAIRSDPECATQLAAIESHIAREEDALELFRLALEPFRSQNPTIHFAEAASRLELLITHYHDTNFFLAAYDIFDGGAGNLPLVGQTN